MTATQSPRRYGDRAARRVRGLEGALVEHAIVRLTALDASDPRAFDIRIAGPGALLVAKLHKLADRSRELGATWLKDKDALDVLCLLRAIPIEELAASLQRLQREPFSNEVTREATERLHALFGSVDARGAVMVVRATEGLADLAAWSSRASPSLTN